MTLLKMNGQPGVTFSSLAADLIAIRDIHLNDYLPDGFVSGVTDVTAALTAWGLAAQAAGTANTGVRMVAAPGVYKYVGVTGSTALIQISDVAGFEVAAAGATFADTRTGYVASGFLFRLYACKNIRFKARCTSEIVTTVVGNIFLQFERTCTIDSIDMDCVGGLSAVQAHRAETDSVTYATRGGIVNIQCTDTFYGWASQLSGSDMTINVDAVRPHRAWIIYGCENLKIYSRAKDQELSSIIIGYNTLGGGCSNIYFEWTDRESTIANVYGVTLEYGSQEPVTHRDIVGKFNTSIPNGRSFAVQKVDNGGASDSVGRGHVLDGLTLTGSMAFTGTGVRDHVAHYSIGELVATGTPDVIRRLDFSNLKLSSAPASGDRFIFNATCLDGVAHVRNVNADCDVLVGNGAAGLVVHTGSQAKRFSASATDSHVYIGSNVTGSTHVAGVNRRAVQSTGTNLATLPTLASAATVVVPAAPLVLVSGTTNITAITARVIDVPVTLKFAAGLTVSASGTVKLAGGANFVATADDTLTLMCDGTTWWEVARSVNA